MILAVLISGAGLFVRAYLELTKQVPAIGGSYTEALLREPRTINPIYASQDTDRDLSRLIFSKILFYNHKGGLETDLAEKYELGPDNKTYTITLRPKIQWHDGKPLTADDVVFTIRAIQNPNYKSVLRANWAGVNVEKIDNRTVRFILRTPYAAFLENLTVGILPKHLWESVTPEQATLHELNLKPVGSGPYRFAQIKQSKDGSIISYHLVRNANYFREGPRLKQINFLFFKSEEEAITALHKNLIDGFGPLSIKHLADFDRQKISVFSLAIPRFFGLFFNQNKNEILKEKGVREAIALALNKPVIADATSGGAVVNIYPLPFSETSIKQDVYPYDPERARAILEKNGWTDEDGNGIRIKKAAKKSKKEPLDLKLKLVTSDWPDLLKVAELIQKDLRAVGIETGIENKPLASLEQDSIRPRNFEILLFGQVYGFETDPFSFWHSSQIKDPGLNISLYNSKKADKIMEGARKLVDFRDRNKKYEELTSILLEDLPAVFLYNQLYIYLLPAHLRGVELGRISLPSDRFNEINRWYADTKRVWNW